MVEFTHTASYMLPRHALYSSSTDPFYFTPNALHFAALDNLIDFTSKVGSLSVCVCVCVCVCVILKCYSYALA